MSSDDALVNVSSLEEDMKARRDELTLFLTKMREGETLADDVSVDELAKLSIEKGMKMGNLKKWVELAAAHAIIRNLCLTPDGKGIQIKQEQDIDILNCQCQRQDFIFSMDLATAT